MSVKGRRCSGFGNRASGTLGARYRAPQVIAQAGECSKQVNTPITHVTRAVE